MSPTSPSPAPPALELTGLFEALDPAASLYPAEARDFVRRLRAEVDLRRDARVLDFGCGLGFVAAELAPHVGEVCLWDPHPRMRERAAATVAALPNARPLDHPAAGGATARFDAIVANSVFQYLSDAEVAAALRRFHGWLTPAGRAIVADVATPGRNLVFEAVEVAVFAARSRVLVAALREQYRLAAWLPLVRRATHLRGADDLRRLGADAGLAVRILPRSLTFRRRRLAAVFAPRAPE